MSREAAETVERFDPEGGKSPGGEWRRRKQPSEPAGGMATGRGEEAAYDWGKPAEAGEPKADRARKPAGWSRRIRSGPLTLEWRLRKGSSRCRRGKGRYERPAPLGRKNRGEPGSIDPEAEKSVLGERNGEAHGPSQCVALYRACRWRAKLGIGSLGTISFFVRIEPA